MGAARCSSSISRPVALIMSGSASTTTYVSAAAKAIATAASPSRIREAGLIASRVVIARGGTAA